MQPNKVTDQNLSGAKSTKLIGPNPLLSLVLGLFLLLSIVASALFFSGQYSQLSRSVPDRIGSLMALDLQNLQRKGALPNAYASIKDVEISSEGSAFKPWVDELELKVPLTNAGTYRLEAFVYFFIDGRKYGANVQYNLVDIKTLNTVWELNRSYHVGWIF